MATFTSDRVREFYAQTYDAVVPDWPGEIDFYRTVITEAHKPNLRVLEIACGTGRVLLRLIQPGLNLVGLDYSEPMLAVASAKSSGMNNIRWVQGDMRTFNLGEIFDLIIIPSHSFQNILTAEDQAATLAAIKRHLDPNGTLIIHLDHQDVAWLGEIAGAKKNIFEPGKTFTHPQSGQVIRSEFAWAYEAAAQTAIFQQVWEILDDNGAVCERLASGLRHFHCMFRFEMEHLLKQMGYKVEAVYGDFFRNELQNGSSEMLWMAKNA